MLLSLLLPAWEQRLCFFFGIGHDHSLGVWNFNHHIGTSRSRMNRAINKRRTFEPFLAIMFFLASLPSFATMVSSSRFEIAGGTRVFEFFSDPSNIAECRGFSSQAAIEKLEKNGTSYPLGAGCWITQPDGSIKVRIKSFSENSSRDIVLPPVKNGVKIDSPKKLNYKQAYAKFADMGLCNACADNVAQHLIKGNGSKCATLAQMALKGDSAAKAKLVEFPDYCEWKY